MVSKENHKNNHHLGGPSLKQSHAHASTRVFGSQEPGHLAPQLQIAVLELRQPRGGGQPWCESLRKTRNTGFSLQWSEVLRGHPEQNPAGIYESGGSISKDSEAPVT